MIFARTYLAFVLIGGFVLGSARGASEPPRKVVPFYGNYMEVFNPIYPQGVSEMPGREMFPLLRYQGDADQTLKLEAEQAVAYGLDGLEVWPSFSAAAHWIDALDRLHFSSDFKIFPQIAPALKMYPTYDSLLQALRGYLRAYGQNPRAARVDGRMLISSWGHGPLDDAIPRLRADLAKEGLSFFWVPTLDQAFPFETAFDYYDGVNSWNTNRYAGPLQAERRDGLKTGRPFAVFGTFRPGYDNGARIFTHDLNPFRGVQSLLDSLEAGLKGGADAMILATWNDINESASFPSWQNPYGYAEIVRFYRSLYAGEPPRNKAPQVVVAYSAELLLGDELEVQMLLLPGNDSKNAGWKGRLVVEDENGVAVVTKDIALPPRPDGHPALTSINATPVLTDHPAAALSIVVTGPDGVARRLAPINVRAGRLRTFRPIVTALDRVAGPKISLHCQPLPLPGVEVPPLQVDYQINATQPVSQTQIMDGMLALYDIVSSKPETSHRLFLAFDSWGMVKAVTAKWSGSAQWLWLSGASDDPVKSSKNGKIDKMWGQAVTPINSSAASIPVDANFARGMRKDTPVTVAAFTVADLADATLQLASSDFKDAASVSIPLTALFNKDVTIAGKNPDTSLRVRLMEDGHILNLAPKLDQNSLSGSALLPAVQRNEPYRVVSLSGELANGDVFFSPPYVWVRQPAKEAAEQKAIQVVASGKPGDALFHETFSYPVDQGYEIPTRENLKSAAGVYSADQVKTVMLPAWRLMGVNLPMNEGLGWLVGDSDSYMSLGWGWRSGVSSRKPGQWRGPEAKDPQWVIDGGRSVLEFRPTGRISLRSRSGLAGAYTLSFDLKIDALGKSQRLVTDCNLPSGQNGPLLVEITPDGCLQVTRNVSKEKAYSVKSSVALTPDAWHQIKILYDLTSLSIVQDGKMVGTAAATPELVRAQSVPYIGASSEEKADGFSGRMTNFQWMAGAEPGTKK